MHAKRKIVARVILCALVLGSFLALAILVGDKDRNATPAGWIPFLASAAIIALAAAYACGAQKSLGFRQGSLATSCVRGNDVPFEVQLENKGPLILLNVVVTLYVSDISGNETTTTTTTVSLSPRASVNIPFNVPFQHVGMFSAGVSSVEVTDFLGLFTRKITDPRQNSICVLPNVPALGNVRFSEDSDAENFKMLKTALADSLDYAYVRDYEFGDPLKTIHWKLSARTDHFLTRLFEKTVSPGVIIVLDFYVSRDLVDASTDPMDEAMELRDAVIETGLAIANFARSKGLDTEVRFVDRFGQGRVAEVWDQSSIIRLVEDMPRSSFDEGIAVATMQTIRNVAQNRSAQNNMVVCSANLSEAMVGTVSAAKALHKSPFFVAAVPHRLVDRALERHLAPLATLQNSGVGYITVSRSEELHGREI